MDAEAERATAERSTADAKSHLRDSVIIAALAWTMFAGSEGLCQWAGMQRWAGTTTGLLVAGLALAFGVPKRKALLAKLHGWHKNACARLTLGKEFPTWSPLAFCAVWATVAEAASQGSLFAESLAYLSWAGVLAVAMYSLALRSMRLWVRSLELNIQAVEKASRTGSEGDCVKAAGAYDDSVRSEPVGVRQGLKIGFIGVVVAVGAATVALFSSGVPLVMIAGAGVLAAMTAQLSVLPLAQLQMRIELLATRVRALRPE